MSRSRRSLLPPLKREWTPGSVQVGLFVRSETGTQIESSIPKANRHVEAAAWWLQHVAFCARGCSMCAAGRGKVLRAYEILEANLKAKKKTKRKS